MIATVARLTRWEWFKLRKRWMPWILLALLVLFSQLGIWGSYFQYRQVDTGGQVAVGGPGALRAGQAPRFVQCVDVLAIPPALPPDISAPNAASLRAQCNARAAQRAAELPLLYANFTVPGSIKTAIGTASSIGALLIAVLAASTVGVEYGWGTMRTTLVRGTGRTQYLTGKFAVLLSAAVVALVVVAIGALIASLVATALVTAPPGFAAPSWNPSFEALGRAWFGLVPIIALTVMLTVLTSSTATGMAGGIGYTIAEPLILALLGTISEQFTKAGDYLLAANISGWNGSQSFGATSSVGSTHHFVVLLIYTAVFVALSVWLLRSRDVSKATGT